MKKPFFLFSLSLLMMYILSCDKSNPVSNGSSIEIIPLRVGNSWVHAHSYLDSNGVVVSTEVESLWVSKDTIVNGQNYFLLSQQVERPDGTLYPDIFTYLARNTSSGYGERHFNAEGIVYNYPYQDGDSTIVASSEIVTVPAGTFNCIVYKYAAFLVRVDTVYHIVYGKSYICPNIGIIKKEFLYPHYNNLGYRYILTRVILKEK